MQFLIYGLIDPVTRQLRYIGKSQRGLLRPQQHSMPSYLGGNTHKNNWVKSLLSMGTKPEIVIIQEFDSPDILSQAEIHWISYFRDLGCPLTNHCRGGNGFTGRHGEEARRKISEAGRRPMSQASKDNLSRLKKGVPLTEAHKQALRVPHRPLSDITKQRMSKAQRARFAATKH